MKSKTCDLCKCVVTPTYAMKHLDEFANKICEHEELLQNISLDKVSIEFSNSFASIKSSLNKRLIFVTSDETNLNGFTLYVHDGTGLNYIPTSKLY